MNADSPQRDSGPSLPADRMFVVQFRPSPAQEAEVIAHGRIEHLVTGLAARFDTWCELRRFVEHTLIRVDEPPSGGSAQ